MNAQQIGSEFRKGSPWMVTGALVFSIFITGAAGSWWLSDQLRASDSKWQDRIVALDTKLIILTEQVKTVADSQGATVALRDRLRGVEQENAVQGSRIDWLTTQIAGDFPAR